MTYFCDLATLWLIKLSVFRWKTSKNRLEKFHYNEFSVHKQYFLISNSVLPTAATHKTFLELKATGHPSTIRKKRVYSISAASKPYLPNLQNETQIAMYFWTHLLKRKAPRKIEFEYMHIPITKQKISCQTGKILK